MDSVRQDRIKSDDIKPDGMNPVTGYIHSFQSLGAVDGPGLRFVVFMQGCPLRCGYCHNPDTWAMPQAAPGCHCLTAGETVARIMRYRPYIKNGGVTVSGGEALMQPEFVRELFALLKQEGIHTALDTSGVVIWISGRRTGIYRPLLADLKPEMRGHTGAVRRVYGAGAFVPASDRIDGRSALDTSCRSTGFNDSEACIRKIARLSASFKNLEKLELLPFKKICMTKYEQMGLEFPFKDFEACSPPDIRRLEMIVASELT